MNLSAFNQSCGWWTLSLWKEHDLFFPSAIWCVFSGLIRGKHWEASVFCRWQRWEHRDKDNRWKRPWYADGTGTKPTGHAPLGGHWKSHVLSFLLLGSPLAPTTALAILPRVRHTGSIHQNILMNLHLYQKLKQHYWAKRRGTSNAHLLSYKIPQLILQTQISFYTPALP